VSVPKDERALVERLRHGDHAALDEILAAHEDVVFRAAARVLDSDGAADAAQEAFLRLWRDPSAFRGGSLRAWLCALARNAALNELRARGRRRVREERRPPRAVPQDPAVSADERGRLADVRAFVGSLPEQEESVIVLYAIEGLSQREVAQALGVSVSSVKQAVLRARAKLRERFGDSTQGT
jgi:RNA polymerase sigma-70 factor (ECF subfamily)